MCPPQVILARFKTVRDARAYIRKESGLPTIEWKRKASNTALSGTEYWCFANGAHVCTVTNGGEDGVDEPNWEICFENNLGGDENGFGTFADAKEHVEELIDETWEQNK